MVTQELPNTHIYPVTSDEFFAQEDVGRILGGLPLDLAFIDGLHLFEQVIADFINVEPARTPTPSSSSTTRFPSTR